MKRLFILPLWGVLEHGFEVSGDGVNFGRMGILPVINIFPSRFCQSPIIPDSRFEIPHSRF
ncbi:hypothetical protein BJP36_36090 [Moorena producens JHB]|uniref:Uncharacterized protein n=1 Tax=Moorena producens (strain JHB) TaxID=1454205 RepID=A0A9Q9UWV9_MOOP1|nr:hypothetical protein BJP36_36090 [Moorena producens JHB]